MNLKLLVLSLAPAMLIVVAARADESTPAAGSASAGRGAHRAEMLARFDKDGDGTLNDEERAAARAAAAEFRGAPGGLQGHFMRQFDADGNGTLDDAERAKAQAAWQAFVAKHDTDGDGKLSRKESQAAREAWATEHPEAAARLREMADTDGDGTVSRKEKREAARKIREKRQENAGGTAGGN